MSIYAQFITIGGGLVGTQRSGQMQIAIYDSVTNLPVNGGNCQVTYQQNINGAITTSSVFIPGLSVPIYTGLLSDTSVSTPYFTTFTILSLVPGTGGGGGVDPAADDLVISYVSTVNESATGAHDGSVIITASSSFPIIQYSLNNSTWQNSNTFTGLSAGAGIAYVKDANAGTVNAPFTVGLTGNILVNDPTIDLGNGNLSRWNAAFNPIWFKYQRKDYNVTGATNTSGNITIAVTGDMSAVKARSIIPSLNGDINSPGDLVYIKTANYAGSYEVLSKAGNSLVLSCVFVANDGAGFININSQRPYYQIQTQIVYVDPVTGLFNTIASKNYPFPDGSCNADLSTFLKSLLAAKDLSNYTLINYRDMQLSASYTIKYAEVWTGNTPQWTTITRPYYVTFAAMQLQQLGGGNLLEYIPYPLSFQPAKWLTDFVNPVYSNGFPFDLSFIFSEYMVGLAPYYHIVLLDINKAPLASQTVNDAFLLNENGTFVLNQDGSKFIIASQSITDTPIVEHVGLNRLLINFTPPSPCWYFSVQLKYTASSVVYNLTQPIICRVDDNTTDRPVYLRWIGLTGSWNYYRFVYNQQVTLSVINEVIIKNFVTDWQNADTIEDVISKAAGEKMMVWGENVSTDDIKGLQAIKFSPKVQLLTSQSPIKWQTVDTGAGTYNERETYLDQYNFSLTFALPSKNIQTQ